VSEPDASSSSRNAHPSGGHACGEEGAGDQAAPAAGDDPFSPSATGAPRAEAHPEAINVALIHQTDPPLSDQTQQWLRDQFIRLAALADVTEADITLVLVDDDQMSDLHAQYHDDPSTTDVLTFDMRDDPAAPLEGDLVLCVDQARQQCAHRDHGMPEELLLYALHGLLHLLGHDDHTEHHSATMHQREDDLLTRAGLGAFFASNPT